MKHECEKRKSIAVCKKNEQNALESIDKCESLNKILLI